MKVLYKITSYHISKLYRGVDYVENFEKITFTADGFIYKKQLDSMLVKAGEGFIYFTYDKNMIHKYQKQIKRLKGD